LIAPVTLSSNRDFSSSLRLRHLHEGAPVLAHGFFSFGALKTAEIAQDEFGIVRITPGLVALDALIRADLGPHLLAEKRIDRRTTQLRCKASIPRRECRG
jgi:hypothetical protein